MSTYRLISEERVLDVQEHDGTGRGPWVALGAVVSPVVVHHRVDVAEHERVVVWLEDAPQAMWKATVAVPKPIGNVTDVSVVDTDLWEVDLFGKIKKLQVSKDRTLVRVLCPYVRVCWRHLRIPQGLFVPKTRMVVWVSG